MNLLESSSWLLMKVDDTLFEKIICPNAFSVFLETWGKSLVFHRKFLQINNIYWDEYPSKCEEGHQLVHD